MLSHSPSIVTDGLVLCLDAANPRSYGGSGTNWGDLSGNGNNGTLVNGPLYDVGNFGRFSVDPSNDYISVSNMPTGNNWTISLWFLIDNVNSFAFTGHRTFAATDRFRFQWDDNGSGTSARILVDYVSGGSQTRFSNDISPEELCNKWHMISLVSDDPSKKCFLDFTEGDTPSSVTKQFSTNGNMRIGIDGISGIGGTDIFNHDGGDCYFSIISVYDRALSPQEIEQNFKATRGRFGI